MKTTIKNLLILFLSVGMFISCQENEELINLRENDTINQRNNANGTAFSELSNEVLFEKLTSTQWQITEFTTKNRFVNNQDFFVGNYVNFYDIDVDNSLNATINNNEDSATGRLATFSSVFLLSFEGNFRNVSNYYKKETSFISEETIVITNVRNGEVFDKLILTAIDSDANDTSVDDFTNSLLGEWNVTKIVRNGRDFTNRYTNRFITFKENNLIVGTNEDYLGTQWEQYADNNFFYIPNKNVNGDLILTIRNNNDYIYAKLNNDWQLVSITSDKIEFKVNQNGYEDLLSFEKR